MAKLEQAETLDRDFGLNTTHMSQSPDTSHSSTHHLPFIDALRAIVLGVYCPLLPTCSGERPAGSTLDDDAATVRENAEISVLANLDVIVIAHSYQGVITANVLPGFSAREPAA